MATRLYPRTKNPVVLETLAMVPAGTALAHAEIDTKFRAAKEVLNEEFHRPETTDERKSELRQEYFRLDEAEWEANHANPNVGDYDKFLTYGWGRVASVECDGYAGTTEDPVRVSRILDDQGVELPKGVTIADLEGLNWN